MSAGQIAQHLQHVLVSEHIIFEQEALSILAEAAQGSMRDSLSLLDQAIAYGQGKVLTQDVAALLGAVPAVRVRNLFAHLATGNAVALRNEFAALQIYAPDYSDLLRRILQALQELSIAQLQAQRFAAEVHQDMVVLAEHIPIELVQLWYQIATDTWQSLPYQPDGALAIEMMLLRMLALQPIFPEQSLAQVRPLPEATPIENSALALTEITETLFEQASEASANPVNKKEHTAEIVAVNEAVMSNSVSENLAEGFDIPPWQEEESEANVSAQILTEQAVNDTAIAIEQTQSAHHDEIAPQEAVSISQLLDSLNQPKRWQRLVESLPNVNGIFIGQNIYPVEYKQGKLIMLADQAGMLWASDANLQQLGLQLSEVFGEEIRLILQGEAKQQTAFETQQSEENARQRQLQAQFMQHSVVLDLQKSFDAQIDEESIRFLDE